MHRGVSIAVALLLSACLAIPILQHEEVLQEKWLVLQHIGKAELPELTRHLSVYAVVYENSQTVTALVRSNEFQYGFIRSTYESADLGNVAPIDAASLFSVDCEASEELLTFVSRVKQFGADFLHQDSQTAFVRVRGDVEKFAMNIPDRCDIVLVSSSPITPAAESDDVAVPFVRPIQKNDKIQALVDAVSEEQQRVFIDRLTNGFNTRLAWASDTVQATSFLVQQFKSYGLEVTTFPFRPNYTDVVIAKVAGRVDPSKIVVIGAHYDDRSANINDPYVRAPGANDDGSGTTAIVEMARVIKEKSANFAYSIHICAWSGEEQGLYGSRAYAQYLKGQGIDVIAMFQSDMIAHRFPQNPLRMEMIERYSTPWLNEDVLRIASIYAPSLSLGYSSACCSDQQSFYEQGYPAVAVVEAGGYTVDPQYHRTGDVYDRADFSFAQLRLITQVVLASAATYAQIL
eukprot:TRINITY_DN597_c0_g1_i1.p1 TRINITY_DN597_c0_g1~~TRINITY_DN597_c0_g1_i1.p1  ORF type:complete len:459 (-),score=115.54 TRINITY_DN597_c0_g1_i1:211-1587(-)